MLLIKSDFILFAITASRRLISTITELVNAAKYATSFSTVKTGTADGDHTKDAAYHFSNFQHSY